MGDVRAILIWQAGPPEGEAGALASALEARGLEAAVHESDAPPAPDVNHANAAAQVIVLRGPNERTMLDRADLCLESGLVRVAVVESATPAPSDERADIVRTDPAWGPGATAAVVEAALLAAREMRQADDLARAHDKLVAVASHDLRTPVSTLRLLHDLLVSRAEANSDRLGPAEQSELDELHGIMQRNLDKMDAFIADVLEAWRLDRGGTETVTGPVSLNAVVEDVVAGLFPAAIQKEIALDLVTDDACGKVAAEARRVGQVVTNLIGNAVKYTPHGGTVTVYTRPQGSAKEGRGAEVEVADTGPGVPEEERARLFKRFSRGSARATGGEPSTGLGLFICREIVEQYRGRIWFEPGAPSSGEATGGGSRFIAFWPAWTEGSKRRRASSRRKRRKET